VAWPAGGADRPLIVELWPDYVHKGELKKQQASNPKMETSERHLDQLAEFLAVLKRIR
jgi:hypothetical protein